MSQVISQVGKSSIGEWSWPLELQVLVYKTIKGNIWIKLCSLKCVGFLFVVRVEEILISTLSKMNIGKKWQSIVGGREVVRHGDDSNGYTVEDLRWAIAWGQRWVGWFYFLRQFQIIHVDLRVTRSTGTMQQISQFPELQSRAWADLDSWFAYMEPTICHQMFKEPETWHSCQCQCGV